MTKVWFITGIARGLGLALARAVLARGDHLVGTTRDGSTPDGLEHERLKVLPLEMTDMAGIEQTVAAAVACHGRLDVVVNNAGYGLLGAVETANAGQVEHLFAVNFFGPLRVIQAVLPTLRTQRRGHIVNITSIASFAPTPGAGLYAASKFALDGLSQVLAQEVAPLGIWVTVVAPGAFRTDFLSTHSLRRTEGGIDDYAATSEHNVGSLLSRAGRQLGDPDAGARAILEAVDADEPPIHLLLGSDALARARSRLDRFEEDLRRWESVSRSTDFAEPAQAAR
jgi:NAD(P)-dependent dehydrogenase (short-subunit alcohol dehydrogenase family)